MKASRLIPIGLLYVMVATGCTPTVAVKAPSEPITVNLNVKIEHEIRVKVDRDLDTLFEDKEGIF
ncbi:YnbE family lipoprotein [Microbulbifer sp. GL-2]|uniref:YnbE family lipoprotein n=1 Tax=Microbulbifer sp. GL-2 TaxID=2591606 RepID=UPI001162D693|nr:YnbE family lipoprotein [Microbulbifer sp. GL-2]BBM02644.1 YnbE family lipoprotein [Microbulbifer sp. GL-2]